MIGEIGNDAFERGLRLEHRIPDGPVHQRGIGALAALVLETFERRRAEEEVRKHVAQPGGELFLALQRSAQHAHRHVGEKCKRCREAGQLLVVPPNLRRDVGHTYQMRADDAQHERPREVRKHEADMPE